MRYNYTYKDKYNDAYQEEIQNAAQSLSSMYYNLRESCFNLAINSSWAEWDKRQEVGSEFNFTDDMLFQTGNTSISLLMFLRERIYEVYNKLYLENDVLQSGKKPEHLPGYDDRYNGSRTGYYLLRTKAALRTG